MRSRRISPTCVTCSRRQLRCVRNAAAFPARRRSPLHGAATQPVRRLILLQIWQRPGGYSSGHSCRSTSGDVTGESSPSPCRSMSSGGWTWRATRCPQASALVHSQRSKCGPGPGRAGLRGDRRPAALPCLAEPCCGSSPWWRRAACGCRRGPARRGSRGRRRCRPSPRSSSSCAASAGDVPGVARVPLGPVGAGARQSARAGVAAAVPRRRQCRKPPGRGDVRRRGRIAMKCNGGFRRRASASSERPATACVAGERNDREAASDAGGDDGCPVAVVLVARDCSASLKMRCSPPSSAWYRQPRCRAGSPARGSVPGVPATSAKTPHRRIGHRVQQRRRPAAWPISSSSRRANRSRDIEVPPFDSMPFDLDELVDSPYAAAFVEIDGGAGTRRATGNRPGRRIGCGVRELQRGEVVPRRWGHPRWECRGARAVEPEHLQRWYRARFPRLARIPEAYQSFACRRGRCGRSTSTASSATSRGSV